MANTVDIVICSVKLLNMVVMRISEACNLLVKFLNRHFIKSQIIYFVYSRSQNIVPDSIHHLQKR